MSYVDAIYNKESSMIHVVERNSQGQRQYVDYPAKYEFYYEDRKGKYTSLHGTKLSKFVATSRQEFEKEKRIMSDKNLHESDTNLVFKCLSEHYLNCNAPTLHTCFFDIEADYHPIKGYAPTSDPFNKITAIGVYLDWLDTAAVLAMIPPTLTMQQTIDMVSSMDDVYLFDNEAEMLETFFAMIEDADILTGWNSECYDIPYMVNRTVKVLGKAATKKFCLLNEFPKERTYERYGKTEVTYDLVGRVHLDYLQLYKKYNYESRHSYKLDFIGEMEVGEKKHEYNGTLDQLYKNDFLQFVTYNKQDVMLLFKIHNKLKFLDLANNLAHENTVLLPTVMGSVAMIDQAIYNEAHLHGLIVPNKKTHEDGESWPIAGAFVANPRIGMHKWVGAVDINSLYPSAIRSLNMAPETLYGQIRFTLTDELLSERATKAKMSKKELAQLENSVNLDNLFDSEQVSYESNDVDDYDEDADDYDEDADGENDNDNGTILWAGLFGTLEYEAVMQQREDIMLIIDYSDGRVEQRTPKQIYQMIFESGRKLHLSANGTIFTYAKTGIIPGLLTKWYSERKIGQATSKMVLSLESGIELEPEFAEQVRKLLEN